MTQCKSICAFRPNTQSPVCMSVCPGIIEAKTMFTKSESLYVMARTNRLLLRDNTCSGNICGLTCQCKMDYCPSVMQLTSGVVKSHLRL